LLDHKRALPGETGLADSRGLLERLQCRAYDGPVTAEPLAACESLQGLNLSAAAARTMTALRSIWPRTVA
jgi:hypothetical protein